MNVELKVGDKIQIFALLAVMQNILDILSLIQMS